MAAAKVALKGALRAEQMAAWREAWKAGYSASAAMAESLEGWRATDPLQGERTDASMDDQQQQAPRAHGLVEARDEAAAAARAAAALSP